jgi:hypothetical protein
MMPLRRRRLISFHAFAISRHLLIDYAIDAITPRSDARCYYFD